MQLLPEGVELPLPDPIKRGMADFLDDVVRHEEFKPADFGLKLSPADALGRLAKAYRL